MIQYLHHNQIDKEKWDTCMKGSQYPVIYAESRCLDIASPGWEALVKGDYDAVMPLTCKKKYGFSYLYQPFPLQQLGVFSTSRGEESLVEKFIDHIPEQYKLIEINLNSTNQLSYQGFTISESINHELFLSNHYENLYGKYSDNLKRNIKKAGKLEIQLKTKISPEDIIALFRSTKGKEIEHLSDIDYNRLLQLMQLWQKDGHGFGIGAYSTEKELLAAGFFTKSYQRIIYIKGATSDAGRKTGAMHYIMDDVIKEYAGGAWTFDFGGSNITSLGRFYKSFGAIENNYLQVKRNNLPLVVRWLK